MMRDIKTAVDKILELGGNRVRFIILYGSYSRNQNTSSSDIDIAVYYEATKEDRFKFRMKILGILGDIFDVQIFQDLPLYIKKEVIKGKVLYYDNLEFLYDLSRKTYRDYEDFKKRFYDYIENGVIR